MTGRQNWGEFKRYGPFKWVEQNVQKSVSFIRQTFCKIKPTVEKKLIAHATVLLLLDKMEPNYDKVSDCSLLAVCIANSSFLVSFIGS